MISVEDAKKIILETATPMPIVELSLEKAAGYYLAEDLLAKINMPPFRQSGMDGYAVNTNGNMNSFSCIAELQAGHGNNLNIQVGEAARIFTGAAVPDDANMIIMQEWVSKEGGEYPFTIHIDPTRSPKLNDHIRPLGEQIKKGDLAMNKGALLNPSALGFLQSLGITQLKVFKKPSFQLIITGNELSKAGTDLPYGSIYESNSVSLKQGILSQGFDVLDTLFVEDDLEHTIKSIQEASSKADIVVLSGGISVGDHDYVSPALKNLGCITHFYKVQQKPGKPLLHGSLNDSSIFALPGNPAASMTCLYEYVIPHARKRSGALQPEPKRLYLPISETFRKKGDRAQFLKGKIEGSEVHILSQQASSMLSSLASADALVYIPKDCSELVKGDKVEVHLIRNH